MNWLPTLMLGVFGTAQEVGIFAIANRTAILTSFILLAINSVSAPKFAAHYKKGEMELLSKTASHTTQILLIVASPILLIFLVFPDWILQLFGEEFIEGKWALRIMAMGQFFSVITGSVGYLLMMTGKERLFLKSLTFSASFALILNATLIPMYGLTGAALATALGLVFQVILTSILVWKHLGIAIWSLKSP